MDGERPAFLERRVGSVWGMTKNKSVISLARSVHASCERRGGSVHQPHSLGRSTHGKVAYFHPHPLPSLVPAKVLVQPPKKPDGRTSSRRKKNKFAGYFSGWDQIADLVLHITAQTLTLAVGRAPSGKWKKQLGVEKGGDEPAQAALLLNA